MYNFEFVQPKTVEEAVEALKAEEAMPLAGGQTLIPTMKQRLASPERLVSLTAIDALKGVTLTDGTLTIGAGETHAGVSAGAATAFPALSKLAAGIGDPAVRNRGTLGGSVANNDPAACYPAAVLACGATVVTNAREIGADDFFDGLFTTVLEEGEIITSIRFPIPDAAAYLKFEQPASRFAMAGVFVARFGDTVRVAVTGASEDGVYRWSEAEDALARDFTPAAIEALSVDPDGLVGDVHGSPEYRANLVKVMTKRAVADAV